MGNGGTLPPNHRAPLSCDDGSPIVLPEGECVWAVCADEIAWVDYDDDDTPVGLRGSMEGISPLITRARRVSGSSSI